MTTTTVPKDFCHLHVHSDGSILDGYSTVKDLANKAKELGQSAITLTDHGNLFGAYSFYTACKDAGVKPIIGIEAYMTPSIGSRTDHKPLYFGDGGPDDVSSKGSYTHITLIAENNVGYRNLLKLTYESYATGYYKKPRIDMDLLREHHEGIIATTGCPSGEIQTRLRLGQFDEALQHAKDMKEIFGAGNYFMELMDHNMTIDLERKVQADLLRIAEEVGLPLLATNDSHYTHKHDAPNHEVQLCISTHSKMSVPTSNEEGEGGKTRFAFNGSGYYVKSYDEMAELFPEDKFPGALSNTVKIAERCNVVIEPEKGLWPVADIPAGKTEEEFLAEEALAGLARRLPEKANDEEYLDRIKFELGVINPKGYASYFLVVSDFMRWCRNNDIYVGYGRGSGAGSLLAYCLDITDPDPIRHGLLFERFLNPLRESPPDLDLDFDDQDRERVIEYVKNKYGRQNVTQVVTYGTMKAKNAIKDVMRVHDKEYSLGDRLSKAMPPAVFGKEMPLRDVYDPMSARYMEAEEFRNLVKTENVGHLVEVARNLEGRIRSTGVHAAAVIISSQPVHEHVPVMMRQADNAYITQWDYPTSEHMGLMKMDFLGLRNLGIVKGAIRRIKKNHGVDINVQDIIQGSLLDDKTYYLLGQGNTLGVFQLDSGPMRSLLRLMKPTNFGDVSALIALYRPGPMGVNSHINYALRKNGRQEIDFINDELTEVLRPILTETYGLIVYQEQVMAIAQAVSSYTLGEADNLRRAMGKKKREVLEKEWVPFLEGAKKNGFSEASVKQLWDILVPFADYAFNKSHSVAYGLLSYVTAYLKAHYPAEYTASLLSSVTDDSDKTALYLDDAKQNGVVVQAPSINRSGVDYESTPEGGVVFGLKAIRGIGEEPASIIAAEAAKGKDFTSLSDFFARLDKTVLNKRVLEGLIIGGALDDLGISRRALSEQLPDLLKKYQKASKASSSKTVSLFDLDDVVEYEVQPMSEWPKMEKLTKERDVLGFYVSAHPLDGLRIDGMATATVAGIKEGTPPPLSGWPGPKDMPVRLAGLLTSLQTRRTKKTGDLFGIALLEDRTGTLECMIWPKTYAKIGEYLKEGQFYQFIGFSKERDEEISFAVDNARVLDFSETSGNLAVRIKLTVSQWRKGREALTAILSRHFSPVGEPGDDVVVSLRDAEGNIWEERAELKVRRSPALMQEIQGTFGAGCVGRWIPAKPAAPNPDDVQEPVSSVPEPPKQPVSKPDEGLLSGI